MEQPEQCSIIRDQRGEAMQEGAKAKMPRMPCKCMPGGFFQPLLEHQKVCQRASTTCRMLGVVWVRP